MLLRFIGEDGLMGLCNGKVYDCDIYAVGGCCWVRWNIKGLNIASYPYNSFKELFEDWQEVGE